MLLQNKNRKAKEKGNERRTKKKKTTNKQKFIV